ncbi:hypothetical protein PMI14_05815 [Acidovorax sp. CF316]|uniref:hypothetical protein n=1 Tax=Acidovorax sp. CF316 TaxID=1144317 RepID=UPI00026BC3FF|nr:hypothetical protein [Acidovorax sp. CF316]EJE49572.1 hypothetical protein PMI14_05815 [Acidovorax sp. CF316]
MYYLDPIEMTAAQLLTGTSLAEDPTPAWAAGTYAVGYECHVVATHRVYRRTVATASATSPDVDPTGWKDMRPTNLWAPFDWYSNTQASSTAADIVYVLGCRYCSDLMLRGLEGAEVEISVKDAPAGVSIWPPGGGVKAYRLKVPAKGFWDYGRGKRLPLTTLQITGLPIRPNAEITIKVKASGTNRRAVGLIARGVLYPLFGTGYDFGGATEGAEAKPKTYTYRKTNDDGTVTTTVRGSSKDLSCEVVMDLRNADGAVQQLEGLLSRPVGVVLSKAAGYAGLSAFGFVASAPVRYRKGFALVPVNVEGVV